MEKTEKMRFIYAVFLGLFSVAVGLAVICVAADIYYSGAGTGVTYTREIAVDRLQKLAIPLILLIGAILFGAIYPLYSVRKKPDSETALKKLSARIKTSGEGEEYRAAETEYNKTRKIRLAVWLTALTLALAAAVASLCYLLNKANFAGTDVTKEMFSLVRFVLPVTVSALVVLSAAAIYNGVLAKKQLAALKKMIKTGKSEKRETSEPAFIAIAKEIWNSTLTLWIVRGAIFAIAVTFVILGVFNGGSNAVLVKAINICQECIGLG